MLSILLCIAMSLLRCEGRASGRRSSTVSGRMSVAIIAMALHSICSVGTTFAQCIDYSDYLHVAGGEWEGGCAVAVAGQHAYVTGTDYFPDRLAIYEISPSTPQLVGSLSLRGGSAVAV